MGHVTCDDETVVAVLGMLKEVPFTQASPLAITPGELYRTLILGGFLSAKKTAVVHSVAVFSASLRRVVHELRRRGVHVEQSRRVLGMEPPRGVRPHEFCIWCDEDALLDIVWRRAPEPMSASTAAPSMPIIVPSAIDPPRRPGQRATMGDG